MPADNVLSGEELTCKTSVNQIGLNECFIPRGCSALRVVLMDIHAASCMVVWTLGSPCKQRSLWAKESPLRGNNTGEPSRLLLLQR